MEDRNYMEVGMVPYQNLSGYSGVAAYGIGADYILVQFDDDSIYLYTYESAGKEHIERMKGLALEGIDLNRYINQFVYKKYARRWRD